MNEKLVTSRELSQRLEEAGVKQESMWYYRILAEHPDGSVLVLGKPKANNEFIISAYLSGELGERLNRYVDVNGEERVVLKLGKQWVFAEES